MKFLSPVVWREGMHLAQHHFQAQNRYFEELTSFALGSLFFRTYGLVGCELDVDALLNGTVSLTHARGLMPDGLAFHFPEDTPPDPLDVGPLFSPVHDRHAVLLAIPPERAGHANCALDGEVDRSGVRYVATPQSLSDEITGSDEKQVVLGRKNFRLLLEHQEHEDLVTLPIARVRRDGRGHFIYDPDYVPPCLQLGASERLLRMTARLVEILDAKSDAMLRERRATQQPLAEWAAREVANFWLTHAVNAANSPLRHLLQTRAVHPERLFIEMSRLAGALCTFSFDAHPRDLPSYDHDDLATCFDALESHIRRHSRDHHSDQRGGGSHGGDRAAVLLSRAGAGPALFRARHTLVSGGALDGFARRSGHRRASPDQGMLRGTHHAAGARGPARPDTRLRSLAPGCHLAAHGLALFPRTDGRSVLGAHGEDGQRGHVPAGRDSQCRAGADHRARIMSSQTVRPGAEAAARAGELALALQEAFTVAVRLRANRQAATDAQSFRAHVKALLASADRDARARGYDAEHVKLAIYAYIAFLDETVLHSSQGMFADWTRQPLQEEIFGEHMAGENFFRYVGELMARQDAPELADLLEVYVLCLLLGFRGKYTASDPGTLQGLVMSIQQKIQRIRGTRAAMPAAWVLPQGELVAAASDPWLRRLALMAGGVIAFALLLFVLYKLTLISGANHVRDAAAQLVSGS